MSVKWTPDRILEAIRAWHRQTGQAPTTRAYHWCPWLPSPATVRARFGSLAAAWQQARQADTESRTS